jgi:hypothetical protein
MDEMIIPSFSRCCFKRRDQRLCVQGLDGQKAWVGRHRLASTNMLMQGSFFSSRQAILSIASLTRGCTYLSYTSVHRTLNISEYEILYKSTHVLSCLNFHVLLLLTALSYGTASTAPLLRYNPRRRVVFHSLGGYLCI